MPSDPSRAGHSVDAAIMRVPPPGGFSARRYFETHFTPVEIRDDAAPLFTAYYEPELLGARTRSAGYETPLYAPPPELEPAPFFTRAEIEAGALSGRGLEIAWLADPVEAFFLHIQGSGRIRLTNGDVMRVGFAARNNHPYRAIGRLLVERGEMTVETASADAIRDWLRAQPDGGEALMNENPSYVFFAERIDLDHADGPIGALGVPLTAGVSIAVDPSHQPLGAPIWAEATGVAGLDSRLTIAQDIGGAIKGAQRADLFFGAGEAAGSAAGKVRATGRMVTLLPRGAAQ